MAFDIRRLDQLTYDDAKPLLEDYIADVVEQCSLLSEKPTPTPILRLASGQLRSLKWPLSTKA